MERTQLHFDRGGRNVREKILAKKAEEFQLQKTTLNCRGERHETLTEVHHTAAAAPAPYNHIAAGRITTSFLGNHAISQVFLSDFWVFRFFHLGHKSIF